MSSNSSVTKWILWSLFDSYIYLSALNLCEKEKDLICSISKTPRSTIILRISHRCLSFNAPQTKGIISLSDWVFFPWSLFCFQRIHYLLHLGLKSCCPYPVNHYPYRLGPLLLLNNSGPPLTQIFNISPLCSYDSPLTGLPVLRIGTSHNTAIALPKNGCPSRIMWLPCSNTQMDLKHSVMPIASRIKSTPQISIQSPSWHGLSSARLLSPPSSLSLCSVIVN